MGQRSAILYFIQTYHIIFYNKLNNIKKWKEANTVSCAHWCLPRWVYCQLQAQLMMPVETKNIITTYFRNTFKRTWTIFIEVQITTTTRGQSCPFLSPRTMLPNTSKSTCWDRLMTHQKPILNGLLIIFLPSWTDGTWTLLCTILTTVGSPFMTPPWTGMKSLPSTGVKVAIVLEVLKVIFSIPLI